MIFVSYSWIEDEPDRKVLDLVERLRKNGYNATCDLMFIQQKTSIHFLEMMANCMREAEKIIIVLSSQYKAKADLFKGGVGAEYRYILEDIEKSKNKYILVSFQEERTEIVPDFLSGREIICLNSNDKYNTLYHRINGSKEYIFPVVNPDQTIPETVWIGEKMTTAEPPHIPEQFESNYKIALASVRKAKRQRELGNMRKSLEYYLQAEEQYREIGDKPRLADVLMSMIVLENRLGNNSQKAEEYLAEVRRMFMETGEIRDYSIITKMGSISSRWGMYDDAMTYYRRAEEGCKKNKDKPALANVYRLMGIMTGKARLNKFDEAKKYLNDAFNLYFSIDDLNGQARIFQSLGDVERQYNNYTAALKNYEKSYDLYVEMDNLYKQGTLMAELYRVCVRLGDESSRQKWKEEIEKLYDYIPEDSRVYIDRCLKEPLSATRELEDKG